MHLIFDLGEMKAGMYVLTRIDQTATVHRAFEDEDGNLSPGGSPRMVTLSELERFQPMPLQVPLNPGSPSV